MAGQRRRNPRGEGDALRGQILEAAEAILNAQARLQDLNVSLREVSRNIGITAPSVYLHFADKKALAWGLVTAGYSRLDEELERVATEPSTASAQDRLVAAAVSYCLFLERRPGIAGLMFGGDPMRWAPAPDAQHPAFGVARRWEALVAAATAGRERTSDDIAAAAVSLWSLLHGRAMLSVIYPDEHTPERLQEFARAAVPALLDAPPEQLAAFAGAPRPREESSAGRHGRPSSP